MLSHVFYNVSRTSLTFSHVFGNARRLSTTLPTYSATPVEHVQRFPRRLQRPWLAIGHTHMHR